MAIKTRFRDEDFRQLLAAYDLGSYFRSEPIEAGTVQTNYHLWTTQGRVVFRYYENRSMESVLFETDLLAYLTARHYPCPAPYANQHGKAVGRYQNKPYAIFEFIEGHTVEKPGPRHRAQLIQKAAELQLITRDFHSRYTPYRWNYDRDLCLTLAQAAAAKIGTANARAKLAWLSRELEALDLPPTLPKGICHCDFHYSNVLFRDAEFAALLDFDDANVTYLQFDLVGLIESFAWAHRSRLLDLVEARSVARAYAAHRPLAHAEQDHLYDVYKLSILFDCVWYFGRGDANDFREKRKIEALTGLSRRAFLEALFGP
jgi:homoserine kinase type II